MRGMRVVGEWTDSADLAALDDLRRLGLDLCLSGHVQGDACVWEVWEGL